MNVLDENIIAPEREERLIKSGGDCRNDGNGAVTVGDVVLKNKGRASFLDLGAEGWIKIDEVDLAAVRIG